MKRKGNTVFTTAEFVRDATAEDFPGGWEEYPLWSAKVIRVRDSHERLLYEVESRTPLFSFPRPYPPAPRYIPMDEYMYRISVASCGVDLWPKGWRKQSGGNGKAAKGE